MRQEVIPLENFDMTPYESEPTYRIPRVDGTVFAMYRRLDDESTFLTVVEEGPNNPLGVFDLTSHLQNKFDKGNLKK